MRRAIDCCIRHASYLSAPRGSSYGCGEMEGTRVRQRRLRGQHACQQMLGLHTGLAVPYHCMITAPLFRRDSAECRWSPEVQRRVRWQENRSQCSDANCRICCMFVQGTHHSSLGHYAALPRRGRKTSVLMLCAESKPWIPNMSECRGRHMLPAWTMQAVGGGAGKTSYMYTAGLAGDAYLMGSVRGKGSDIE